MIFQSFMVIIFVIIVFRTIIFWNSNDYEIKLGHTKISLINNTLEPVHIMVPLLNSPEFIEWHILCYQKYLLEPFELTIFNDAFTHDDKIRLSGSDIRQKITESCMLAKKKYPLVKLNCVDIPPSIHAAGSVDTNRCFETTQFVYDNYIQNSSILTMFHDSDIFLSKRASAWNQILMSKIAFIIQERGENVRYIWNGFILFNTKMLKNEEKLNFQYGLVEGQSTDVGGQTHYWLLQLKRNCNEQQKKLAQPSMACTSTYLSQYIPEISIYNKDYLISIPNTFLREEQRQFLINDLKIVGRSWAQFVGRNFEWLHLRGAGNWQGFNHELILERKSNAYSFLFKNRDS